MSRDSATLRHSWGRGRGESLARRQGIAAHSLLAAGSIRLIASHQFGLIRRLPDPSLPGFDSEKVAGLVEAYVPLGTPEAALNLGRCAITLGLAAMGGRARAANPPWLPMAPAAKVSLDAALAGRRALGQWPRHRALRFWCLMATGASFAPVPLAPRTSLGCSGGTGASWGGVLVKNRGEHDPISR